jgi:hypothetical protein
MLSKNLLLPTNVKLHLELALVTREMVDLGDDSNECIREENEKDQKQ